MRKLTAVLLLALTVPAVAAIQVSTEVAISNPPEIGPTPAADARIATNGEMYVAVWTDYRASRGAIFAARFRRDGTLLDPVGVRIAPGGTAGAVIWSGRTFLVAYLQQGVVRVRALAPDGRLGAPIDLFGSSVLQNVYRIRMATNGDSVLLVTSDAAAALLEPDGQMRRQISMPWVWARTGLGVAAAGSTYLVAAGADLKVKTQIVTASGDLGALQTLARGEPLGLDVASDGERFLVTWALGHVQAQFVTRGGEPVEPVLALTSSATPPYAWARTVIGLVWRGNEYVLVYGESEPFQPLLTMRISASGEPRGPLFTGYEATVAHLVIAPDGTGALIGWRGGILTGAFFEPQRTGVHDATRLALAARRQREVRLAALPGSGVAAAWIEYDTAEGHTLHLSRGPGSAPVLVADKIERLIDVVADQNTIWMLWTGGTTLYARRYTHALVAVDAAPVAVGTLASGVGVEVEHAAAGGGTVIVVNENPNGGWYEPGGPHIQAHVLRGTGAGIAASVVEVASEPGRDHDPVVTWNGNAFVVAWANALEYTASTRGVSTNDVDTGFEADDRILTMRLDSLGRRLDTAPVEVARGRHVETLTIAHGWAGTALAWQPYHAPDASSRRRTYAALAVPRATVVDLGGEDMHLAAFTAHDRGFLLARAAVSTESGIARPEVLALDSALAITDRVALAPFVTDVAFWRKTFDADLVGGASAAIAYARVADGAFGHVSRSFVRRLLESQRRRTSRK